jgi:hypothetical protein
MDSNKKAWHDCETCRGVKVIPSKICGDLYDVCPECHGAGGRDWVQNAMGRYDDIDPNLRGTVVYSNIQRLIQMIYEEGRKIGMDISVDVKSNPGGYHDRMYTISPSGLGSHVHSSSPYNGGGS